MALGAPATRRTAGASTAAVLILSPSPSSPTRPENLSGEDLRQAGLGSDQLRFKKSCPAAPSYGSRRRTEPACWLGMLHCRTAHEGICPRRAFARIAS